jgi:hypothetical protein
MGCSTSLDLPAPSVPSSSDASFRILPYPITSRQMDRRRVERTEASTHHSECLLFATHKRRRKGMA